MTPAHPSQWFFQTMLRLRGPSSVLVSWAALTATACGGDAFQASEDNTGAGGTNATSTGGTGHSSDTSSATTGGGGNTTTSGASSASSSSGTSRGSTTGGVSSSSSGGSVASSSSSGSMGSGGGSSTTDAGATLTTGGPPTLCELPLVSGNCNAYFASWGFDPTTGHCESFVYGGCGGNDNRFESLEACLDVCDPGGLTACETSAECTFDMGCCGMSGTASLENLKVVNYAYSSARAPECALVDCAYVQPEGIEQFGARCSAGTCEAYDVRNDSLSVCTEDTDCRLRNGLGCCEGCGEVGWVAIATAEEASLYASCGDVACAECAALPPEGMQAVCGRDGHCQVVTE